MLRPSDLDAAHARLRGERDELGALQVAAAQPVSLLREHDDRASLGCLVREARELRRVGELLLRDARRRDEVARLPVAERDRAGLVEEQGRAVSGRLDRAAAHGQDVALHEAIHAGDADGREQRADRRRDEADEQGDEHDHRLRRVGVDGVRLQRDRREEQHDREAGEEDVERDLVRGLLAARTFDERDHPVEEALTRLRGDTDDDLVGEDARAARDSGAVAARLADHRRRLARDRRLVDARDPLHDVAVGRDHLAGRDDDLVAHARASSSAPPRRLRRASSAARSSPPACVAAPRPGPCRAPRPSPRRSSRRAR